VTGPQPAPRRWTPSGAVRATADVRSPAGLEQSGLEKITLDGVRPVEAAIRYFRARLPRMDYAAARRDGLPIGSGNVEATCKSLVTVRMKRLGARYGQGSGELTEVQLLGVFHERLDRTRYLDE